MKDILSIGLEQKQKSVIKLCSPPLLAGLVWRASSNKIPADESITDDTCKTLAVTASDEIQQHLAAG